MVHKTMKIRDELEHNNCLAIHNCPYAPDLNLCERFIKLHKQKIKVHLAQLK
jgi:hypothetical protein